MAVNIVMPKLGMTMEEGTVSHWLVQEGQQVEQGCPVLEIETEKITHEIEALRPGIVHITSDEGDVFPCGGTCGIIAASQAEYQALLSSAPAAKQAVALTASVVAADGSAPAAAVADAGDRVVASPAARKLARELGVDISLVRGSGPGGRVIEDDVRGFVDAQRAAPAAAPERVTISPAARKLAEDHGIDFGKIRGTGPGGRILREDVLAALEQQAALLPTPAPPAPEAPAPLGQGKRVVARTVPLTGVRRAIADHVVKSFQGAAQLTCILEVDVTELNKVRKDLAAESERMGVRIMHIDLVARAALKALQEFPIFNSSVEASEIKIYDDVNLGIAVNSAEGLVVPVVHNADKMGLTELSKAIAAQVEKASKRGLGFGDVTDGTFTISNLSAHDVIAFTPILNSPEVAILGLGGIADRPVVVKGEIVIRSMMYLSFTWDHRVADGVPAVQFVEAVKRLIEKPARLLV